jgi:hypothetical protein
LNTIKITINRVAGNGMKIIKFHLITHFADDILRFGSMNNYDSCIGERHHSSEVKDPAGLTQRRKSLFEYQTASRYFEQQCIERAYSCISTSNSENNILGKDLIQMKNNNIIYDEKSNLFKKRDSKTKKFNNCCWKDTCLTHKLSTLCVQLLEDGSVSSPIKFFTQHNRDEIIFHGDPNYNNEGNPWYDWANVVWDTNSALPSKILIFIDLRENFLKPFEVGGSYITEPGCYAVSYTWVAIADDSTKQMADSRLVKYGQLTCDENDDPIICLFSVESIHSPCITIPYNVNDSIIEAKEWLMIESRVEWYDIFLDVLKNN